MLLLLFLNNKLRLFLIATEAKYEAIFRSQDKTKEIFWQPKKQKIIEAWDKKMDRTKFKTKQFEKLGLSKHQFDKHVFDQVLLNCRIHPRILNLLSLEVSSKLTAVKINIDTPLPIRRMIMQILIKHYA